jgi:hypothetical protein
MSIAPACAIAASPSAKQFAARKIPSRFNMAHLMISRTSSASSSLSTTCFNPRGASIVRADLRRTISMTWTKPNPCRICNCKFYRHLPIDFKRCSLQDVTEPTARRTSARDRSESIPSIRMFRIQRWRSRHRGWRVLAKKATMRRALRALATAAVLRNEVPVRNGRSRARP